ncbi:MAG: hypothetical protein FJY29_00610 [Betaproteobacteria bacterium]|nr:hypothetical protein [Betaproteobacteria bacterium]
MKATLSSSILSEIHGNKLAWHWPQYQSTLGKEDLCAYDAGGMAKPPLWWNTLPQKLMGKYQSAAFIEWRYFSILSPDFHGICGFSLFNPEHHLPQFAEGGLIAIVAGALDGAAEKLQQDTHHRAGEELEKIQEFCFMHVFPMETVIFHGENRQNVSASHDGIELKIDMVDLQTADIQLEMEGGVSVRLRHQALPGSPVLPPVTATDFRTVPGAHWTIFNPSPVAQVSGTVLVRPGLLRQSEAAPSVHNPNFVSPPLASRLDNGFVKIQITDAPGYYEHSFGLNPMPLHGWDFLFVPTPEQRAGLVLQTYRGSADASYLEVMWQQSNAEWKVLHVPVSQCSIDWSETSWHPALRVHVPRKRTIKAQLDGYQIEIQNKIFAEIPFIRAHSPVVRHFFIAEEISATSWKVIDAQGKVCVDVKDALSGGETARGRWYYSLQGLFALSAAKPF